jgi:hypothetical protein
MPWASSGASTAHTPCLCLLPHTDHQSPAAHHPPPIVCCLLPAVCVRSIPDHICASHLDLTLKLAPRGAKRVQLVLGPLLQHHQVPAPGDTISPGDDISGDTTTTTSSSTSTAARGARVVNRQPSSGWLATVQAAAVTYEFDTCQLQVLVGPPADVEDALKQQNKPFAKAPGQPGGMAAPPSVRMASSLCEGCPVVGAQPMNMPATPAPPGNIPPSPVRTLCCQLRGEPHQEVTLRLLLDYSILELFTGTGEVLTTRVYRGAPTARAAALAAKKEAALAAADAHAQQVGATIEGSLGEVGGLLHSSSLRQVSTSFSFTHLSGDGSDELASPQYRPGWLSPGSGGTSPLGGPSGVGVAPPSPGDSSASPFRRSQSARSPRLRWGSPRLPAAGSPHPPWLEGDLGSGGDAAAGVDSLVGQQLAALTQQVAQMEVQQQQGTPAEQEAGHTSSSGGASGTPPSSSTSGAAQLLSREQAGTGATPSPPAAAAAPPAAVPAEVGGVGSGNLPGGPDQGGEAFDTTPTGRSAGKKAPDSTPAAAAAAAAGVGGVKGAALAWAEVSLMAVGGDALVTRLEAHEMGSMWA